MYTKIQNVVIFYLWIAFWAGEAWSKVYGEAQYISLAAAHVAFGLLREIWDLLTLLLPYVYNML